MIRVNLLRGQVVRTPKRAVRRGMSRLGLTMITALVLIVGGLAAWWYSIQRDVAAITQTRDHLRQENARLAILRKEIEQYESLRKLRASRIEVIEKLKQAQTGPVLLLNRVIRSIPADHSLWLTLLDQKGERIQIAGFCERSEAVPTFMSNLAATGHFASVDLEVLENDKNLARFALVCVAAVKAPTE